MLIIEEFKSGNESYYRKTISSDSLPDQTSLVFCKAVTITKGDTDFYLLYKSNMEVYSEAFEYINGALADKSNNTQIKAHEALKFLMCFQEIIGKSLQDFLSSDVDALKYFLHGYSPKGRDIDLKLLTIRSNETVNGYLSVYRGYLEHLGISNHILFATDGKFRRIITDDAAPIASASYRKNDRTPQKVVEVPKYISVDEFVSILKYVREHYSLKEELIIRLMYQCGLRIGEVLGLTADDLVMEKMDNGTYAPLAYLRNRVSDSKDQNAKSCMKVFSKKQYATSDYNTKDFGYQTVVVPRDLFVLINEYIEDAHVAARDSENQHDRYYKNTIADRVYKAEDYEDDNYYIFINSIGTPLSASSWNTTLRDIFNAVGIKVDKDKRKNNLNHRFRHGFAMFNVMYLGIKEVELARLLRHSSTLSVICYYRPTISDQIKLKTQLAESLYEIIPSLRRENA